MSFYFIFENASGSCLKSTSLARRVPKSWGNSSRCDNSPLAHQRARGFKACVGGDWWKSDLLRRRKAGGCYYILSIFWPFSEGRIFAFLLQLLCSNREMSDIFARRRHPPHSKRIISCSICYPYLNSLPKSILCKCFLHTRTTDPVSGSVKSLSTANVPYLIQTAWNQTKTEAFSFENYRDAFEKYRDGHKPCHISPYYLLRMRTVPQPYRCMNRVHLLVPHPSDVFSMKLLCPDPWLY